MILFKNNSILYSKNSRGDLNEITGFDDTQKELSIFLTQLFDTLFPVGIFFGGIALTASIYRSIHYGWYFTLFLNVGMYLVSVVILIFRRYLPSIFMFLVMIGLISIEVIHSFLYRGVASAGMMNLAIVCIFTGIFIGKKAGIFAVVVGAFFALFCGIGFSVGALKMSIDINDHLLISLTWFIDISLFIMYVICLILTVNGMQRQIIKSLYESKETASHLKTEIEMRKQIECELRDSEEKYRSIFTNAAMGIFQSNSEGQYLNVNPAYAKLHGFDSPEEFLTHIADVESCISHEDYRQFSQFLDTEGIVEGYELQKYHRTRDKIWVLANVRRVLDKNGQTFYEGTVQNITDRKRAEEALRESEGKFRDLVEKSLVGVYLVQDDIFKYVNLKFAEILSYTVDEILDKVMVQQVIFPEDWPMVDENIRKRISGELESCHYEIRIVTKNKQVRNVETYSSVTKYKGKPAVIGTLLDITERKHIEQALLESEAKYRTVVENSLIGFCIVRNDIFQFVNQRFCEITGYGYDEIVTTNYMDLVHPDDRIKMLEHIHKCLHGDKSESEHNFRAIRKDGEVIIIKAFCSLLIYGGSMALFGTFMDVTQEKTLESQLRQAQKMEAVGTLAGGIAHDFNNILTALIGYGMLLQARTEPTDRSRLYADQILSASHKCANLTQSLLAFSRKSPISLKPVELNAIIRGTEKLLRRLITEDITLETHLSERDMIVLADSSQIDQILFNLITNARDAMPRGGKLTIRSKQVSLDNNFILDHGFGEAGCYVLLSVEDTGTGMDAKTLEKSFDPFFTTKDMGKGTGLGLATVYGIVKQHNGYITVDSEPAKGTSFHIYLPAIKATIKEECFSTADIHGGRETILIAEDNEEVRHFIKEILIQYGYTVVEAVDGEDAVAKFQSHQGIDLVILDAVMPKLNGKDAYDIIQSFQSTTRFLFISGYMRNIILDKGIRENECDFLKKPLLPNQLLKMIRGILDRKE